MAWRMVFDSAVPASPVVSVETSLAPETVLCCPRTAAAWWLNSYCPSRRSCSLPSNIHFTRAVCSLTLCLFKLSLHVLWMFLRLSPNVPELSGRLTLTESTQPPSPSELEYMADLDSGYLMVVQLGGGGGKSGSKRIMFGCLFLYTRSPISNAYFVFGCSAKLIQ